MNRQQNPIYNVHTILGRVSSVSFKRLLLLIIGFMISGSLVAVAMGCFQENTALIFLPPQATEETEQQGHITNIQSPEPITLPINVAGTDLLAQCFASYDGNYLETDAGNEVTGVAALLVQNSGETMVLQARVNLEQGSNSYTFWITMLPPGESVLVLDENAAQYQKAAFTACYGKAVCTQSGDASYPSVKIKAGENDTLVLQNVGKSTTPRLEIFYKSAYAQGLFYLGGRAKSVIAEPLQPGEKTVLKPEFYVEELSRILYIDELVP